jgi:hypothetical protein
MAEIRSFRVSIPPQPIDVDTIAKVIQSILPNCQGLVRWAITQTEASAWVVEGAYLTN